MPVIQSQISPASDAFRANAERMRALVADIRDKAAVVEQGGSQEARERHRSRGKLLPRERLAQLLDTGSPFLEIGQFAAWDMYGGDIASAGMIAGIGRVEGREVMVVVNENPSGSRCSYRLISDLRISLSPELMSGRCRPAR